MSVDDLIRDQLEALVEPLEDPGAIVASIERRHQAQRRRTLPMLAAAAAIVVVVAIGGAIWLGGEPDRQVVAGPDTTATSVPSTEPADPDQGDPSTSCDGVELPDLTAAMPEGFTGPFAGLGGGGSGPPCARHWQGPDRGIHVSQLPGSSPFGLVPDGEEGLFRWGPIHEGFGIEYAGEVPWNAAAYGLDESSADHLLQALLAADPLGTVPLSARLELLANSVEAAGSLDGEMVVQNDGPDRVAVTWEGAQLHLVRFELNLSAPSDPRRDVTDPTTVQTPAGGVVLAGTREDVELVRFDCSHHRFEASSEDLSTDALAQFADAVAPALCGAMPHRSNPSVPSVSSPTECLGRPDDPEACRE